MFRSFIFFFYFVSTLVVKFLIPFINGIFNLGGLRPDHRAWCCCAHCFVKKTKKCSMTKPNEIKPNQTKPKPIQQLETQVNFRCAGRKKRSCNRLQVKWLTQSRSSVLLNPRIVVWFENAILTREEEKRRPSGVPVRSAIASTEAEERLAKEGEG